jgi:hypothetical protein
VIKSRIKKWAGQVAYLEGKGNAHSVLVKESEGISRKKTSWRT